MFAKSPLRSGWARPRLVVSRCLDLEPCRYNGAVIETPLVRRLGTWVELFPVCPEVEIGLGVPRPPVRLVRRSGATTLLQPATGRDLTAAMGAFADGFLAELPDVDGFLLKARSPSCGIHGVKVFPDPATEAPAGREPGMFARAVLARFPDHPVEHEGRLANSRLLDHFLTRLFALAALRRAREERPDAEGLAALHARNRLLAMTFADRDRRELEAAVAGLRAQRSSADLAWNEYGRTFRRALATAASPAAHQQSIEQALRDLAAATDSPTVPTAHRRAVLLHLLRERAVAAGLEELADQTYLNPYPADLVPELHP